MLEDSNDKNETYKKTKTRRSSEKATTLWVTRSIAEELGREAVLKRTLIEFVIYVGFVLVSTIYIIGINTTRGYYLTRALKQQFLEQEFETVNNIGISFEDIKTAADFWFYVEKHMIKSFFWESTYDSRPETDENAMNILHENKILGVPRMRQVKVRNDSCIIHSYFRRLFLNCFDEYSVDSEDTKPFGPESGTAWIYTPSDITKNLAYTGKISTYNGGGYFVDLAKNKDETFAIIEDLMENLWITRGTRAVFVDFSLYNANLNIFGICKLIFEFPTTGGIIPSANFHSITLLRFHTNFDWFILVCQCCCYIFLLYYISEEITEMIYFKSRYWKRFWNYIDWIIILLLLSVLAISVILIIEVPRAIQKIKNSPEEYGNLEYVTEYQKHHNHIAATALYFIYLKAFKYLNVNRTMGQLNNTLSNCAMDVLGFSLMFFIVFLAYAELGYLLFGSQVEGFSNFGTAMFTLLRTILGDFDYNEIERANRILAPIYFLSYIFLVFFVLLVPEVDGCITKQWILKNLQQNAMFTVYSTNRLNYKRHAVSTAFKERTEHCSFREIRCLMHPMNMFLAIINDTYADVKTENAIAPDEMQMTEYVQRCFRTFLKKMGCGRFLSEKSDNKAEINATIRDINDMLRKFGYSNVEIEMFLARYNINPLADMHVKDTEKLLEELKNIMDRDAKGNGYVRLEDFKSQQDRLNEIEKTIGELVRKLQELLYKLENMENVDKTRKI